MMRKIILLDVIFMVKSYFYHFTSGVMYEKGLMSIKYKKNLISNNYQSNKYR